MTEPAAWRINTGGPVWTTWSTDFEELKVRKSKDPNVRVEYSFSTSFTFTLLKALRTAEAALSDIGDAEREPTDDVAWCENRAAEALPEVRAALQMLGVGF